MSEHAGSHQRSCDERSEEAARLRAAGKRGRQRMHTLYHGLLACALPLARSAGSPAGSWYASSLCCS